MWIKIPDLPNAVEGNMPSVTDGVYLVAYQAHESKTLNRTVLHAIIFRQDGQAIAGWDEVQRVKNEVFGPDANAYEVYPPEAHKVNTFNARHLWIMSELPFGYRFRATDVNEPKLRERQQVVW